MFQVSMESRKISFLPQVEAFEGMEIVDISAGNYHSVALTAGGEVYTWGKGDNGVLGTGGSSSASVPVLLDALEGINVIKISCGDAFTVALTGNTLKGFRGLQSYHLTLNYKLEYTIYTLS